MQTKKNTFETISSDEAKQFWPTLAADFLEKCVVWQMSSSQTDQFDHVKSEVEVKENVIPIRISCKINFCYFFFIYIDLCHRAFLICRLIYVFFLQT